MWGTVGIMSREVVLIHTNFTIIIIILSSVYSSYRLCWHVQYLPFKKKCSFNYKLKYKIIDNLVKTLVVRHNKVK